MCLTQISRISRNTRATACVYHSGRKHSAMPTAASVSNAAFREIREICVRLKSAMKEFRVFCEIRVRKKKGMYLLHDTHAPM